MIATNLTLNQRWILHFRQIFRCLFRVEQGLPEHGFILVTKFRHNSKHSGLTGDKILTCFQKQWFILGTKLRQNSRHSGLRWGKLNDMFQSTVILRTNFRHNSRHIGLQWGHNLDTFPVKVVLKVLIIQMFQCNIVCYFG